MQSLQFNLYICTGEIVIEEVQVMGIKPLHLLEEEP
jgi:hypothetical protein